MPIVAFYSKDSNIELLKEWENRLQVYFPSIKLVDLLSDQAENAITALIMESST